MYILNSNFIKNLTKLKRKSKSYKQLQRGVGQTKESLVKLLYKGLLLYGKVVAPFLYHYYIVSQNKIKLDRYITRKVRFYDYKFGLCCKDIMECLDNNKIGSLLAGYVIHIGFYGTLICYALNIFDIPFNVTNIITGGILFYFLKEEFYPMVLLLLRGVKL